MNNSTSDGGVQLENKDDKSQKFLFSSVWEDSDIEYSIIQKRKHRIERICFIGSGGDTFLSVIQKNIYLDQTEIHVVDYNLKQIFICVLKLLVSHHFYKQSEGNSNQAENKLNQFLKGELSRSEYSNIVAKLKHLYKYLDYSKYLNFWLQEENLDILQEGLNNISELEKTFHRLVNSGFNFDDEFDQKKLEEQFGIDAVKLTKSGFITHFNRIVSQYREKYPNPAENKFYFRMINGYDQKINYIHQIEYVRLDKIKFYHTDIVDHLSDKNNYYGMIQLSNVTDWMNLEENIIKLVDHSFNACKYSGHIIFRQLNGDYDLENILSDYSHSIMKGNDMSHFYNNTFIVQKNINIDTILKDVSFLVNKEKILSHPFFKRLDIRKNKNYQECYQKLDNNMIDEILLPLEIFKNIQVPFYYAVKEWVEILVLFHLTLKNDDSKKLIEENINDEMGEGDDSKSHQNTFKGLLKSIGFIETDQLDNTDIDGNDNNKFKHQEVTSFIKKIEENLQRNNSIYNAAYLGAIEYSYIFISDIISDYLDFHNIDQEHYKLHEELDKKHARDLFDIAMIEPCIRSERYMIIETGINDGYKDFIQMYFTLFINIYLDGMKE